MNPPFSKTFGAILLTSGCCIGAGMLGLPLTSSKAGFMPSTLMLFASWLFMFSTALLLLEATLWFKEEVNLLTIAENTLGKVGKWIACALFLFLFNCLLVAYLSGISHLVLGLFDSFKSPLLSKGYVVGGFSLFVAMLLLISTKAVDYTNRFLVFFLILFYVLLIGLGLPYIQSNHLKTASLNQAVFLAPTLIISFGFHNLIPSLANYLKREKTALCKTFFIGSLIPLLVYFLFDLVILGLLPKEGFLNTDLSEDILVTELLTQGKDASFVFFAAQGFSFFAILTSFLGIALSFLDFLADALKIKKTKGGKLLLLSLSLFPAFFCSLTFPNLFTTAINYAGAFGATLLFGVFPVLMVWKGRKQRKELTPLFPGGNTSLLVLLLAAIAIFIIQFVNEFFARSGS